MSSKYWYTKEGVYRQSDHWGGEVASCSWFIKGREYRKGMEDVQVRNKETAFIRWEDLKPKGVITHNSRTGKYGLYGFDFKK